MRFAFFSIAWTQQRSQSKSETDCSRASPLRERPLLIALEEDAVPCRRVDGASPRPRCYEDCRIEICEFSFFNRESVCAGERTLVISVAIASRRNLCARGTAIAHTDVREISQCQGGVIERLACKISLFVHYSIAPSKLKKDITTTPLLNRMPQLTEPRRPSPISCYARR